MMLQCVNVCYAGIRNTLLQSDNHTCPSCNQDDSSPDKLVANQFLRTAVRNFRNETGYARAAKKAGVVSGTAQGKPYDSPSQNLAASADIVSSVAFSNLLIKAFLRRVQSTYDCYVVMCLVQRKVVSSSNLSRVASPYLNDDVSSG